MNQNISDELGLFISILVVKHTTIPKEVFHLTGKATLQT